MHYTFTIERGNFTDAGQASSSVKRTLKQLGVDPVNIKRTVVALFEAEINAVAHAYGGTIDVDIDGEKIVMVVADEGPGIPNLELAMQEGWSTASPKVRERAGRRPLPRSGRWATAPAWAFRTSRRTRTT